MENIMVCVTGQMQCKRLLSYALDLQKDKEQEVYLVHVSVTENKNFTDSMDALEYLYDQAVKNGASLSVLKPKTTILDTLVDFIKKNHVVSVVMGETREAISENSMIERLKKKAKESDIEIEIHIVKK
ncbi:universal stress protein [Filifactor alocis]